MMKNINKLISMYEDVVSMADFKAKKGGEDETLVHINSVIITGCEGLNNDDRFPFGQEISLEEAQTLINKEDYKKYIQGMGCDKCFFQPKFTVNGEEKSISDYLKYSSELRVDLHDGAKYGYEQISIIDNLKAVLEHSGLKNVIIDNKEIPYDKAALEKEFGTKEEAMQKYVDSHKVEIPQGKGCADKTIEEIAVGDIFHDSDYSDYSRNYYYDFYRVVKKTSKSVWFEPLKRQRVEEPVIKDGRIDYQGYQYPSDEVDADKQGKGYHLMDFSKPFRLTTKYDNKVKAEQGAGRYKVTLYPWSGTALAEEFKMGKSIYAKLNEEVSKYLNEDTTISGKCLVYVDGSDGSDERISLYDGEKLVDWKAVDLDCPTDEFIREEAKKYFDIPNDIEVKRPLEVKESLSENNKQIREFEKEFKDLTEVDGVYLFTDNNNYDGPYMEFCIADDGVYDELTDSGFKNLLNSLDTDTYKIKNDKYEISAINDDGFGINLSVLPNKENMPSSDEVKKDLKELAKKIKDLMKSDKIEKMDESLNEEKEKLDIRELIEGYNFIIIKTRVPEIEVLEKSGMDEFDIGDYEGHVGEPCFVLYDNMKNEVRAIFLGETLTPQISIDIAENLDTIINDSIWEDVVDNFIPKEDRAEIHDFPKLFEYLKSHDTDVSEWETTVVEMLATGNEDLFKEITDMKEEDFKETFGIRESFKENKEDILKKIADEVKAKIEKIYADDKDLLEYFHVETGVKKGHYDDGSDMYFIEVRTELDYNELLLLSEKLDEIVQKYDKYAYFDMEGGGIITAVIDNDLINESLNEAETYPKMLTTLVKKCWYGNGRFARNGKWSIGLGGYDHGYEVYFDGDVICQIKPDNEVYFGRSEDAIKEICGYGFEQILKAIQEVEPDTFIKEDEYKLIIEFEEEYLDEIFNITNELNIDVDEAYNTYYGIYSNDEDKLDEIASKIKEADKNGHFNIRVIEV